jgi:hypothetical protein
MKVVLLLLSLLFASQVTAQESFKLPPNPKGMVVDYLDNMKIKDPSRRLSDTEKHNLCRLFVKVYVTNIRKHHQDYYLFTGAPVYRLLVTNFPEVVAREGEGGSIIFLGAITNFFNALLAYRADVEQVLREGIDRRHCKHL